MKRSVYFFIFSCIFSLLNHSCKCTHDDKQKSYQTVKTEGENKKLIEIQRFEKELFSLNIDSISKYIPLLKSKYREFFDIYNYKIIQLGGADDPKYPGLLKGFLTDYYMNLNYQKVIEVFPDLKWLEDELDGAFRNYRTNFPDATVPHVYTCISGWNQSVFTTDTLLGIALDKYLGRNCEFYEKLGIAKYMRNSLDKAYISSDCIRSWGYAEFEFNDSSGSVLTTMLYEGKILYFVKSLLPDKNDTLVFGYTPAQLKWCENNINRMWSYLTEHKMLFSTDYMMLRKLFFTAPFTVYFTNESPGRSAVWLGYKIIESYMKTNSKITLQQLMEDGDYQKILRTSNFQP
jgi:hypothetical protein